MMKSGCGKSDLLHPGCEEFKGYRSLDCKEVREGLKFAFFLMNMKMCEIVKHVAL